MRRVEKVLFGFVVVVLVGTAAATAFVVVRHVTRCDRFHFDAVRWQAGGRAGDANKRKRTANHLIECRRLEGLSAARVRSLLGEPDHRSAGGLWSYEVGTDEGWIFPTRFSLELELDRTRHVAHAEVADSNGD
jgi:hypothetical protein